MTIKKRSDKKVHRLTPELIPGDLWGRSAFRLLGSKSAWRKSIRPDAIAAAKSRCQICGQEDQRLTCHEKWTYDDQKLIATLTGFEIHCSLCDLATHFKRAMKIADPQEVLIQMLTHLCRVNERKESEMIELLKEADSVWEKRNKKKWRVEVVPRLLKSYPDLEALPSFRPPLNTY